MEKVRQLLNGAQPLALDGQAVNALIASGSGEAALLYLYILRQKGAFDPAAAGAALGWTAARVEKALHSLESLSLVGEGRPAPVQIPEPAEELPRYELEDVKKRSADGDFARLVTEVQRLLGRVLSGPDLMTLFGVYDHLGLPAEVILLLISHCMEEMKRRYGEGRRVSMRTIEKTAYQWAREELFTLSAADAYLRARATRQTEEGQIKAALGIRDRQLSPTEARFVRSWQEMGYTAETLELAYDRTVVNTGALNWKYMDSIVRSWNAKGLKTPTDIERRDGGGKSAAKAPERETGDDLELLRKQLGMK